MHRAGAVQLSPSMVFHVVLKAADPVRCEKCINISGKPSVITAVEEICFNSLL